MDLRGSAGHLRPGKAEGNAEFRDEIRRQARAGVLLLGVIEIAAALFLLVLQSLTTQERSHFLVRGVQCAALIGIGALTWIAARRKPGLGVCRILTACSVWFSSALLIWLSLVLTPGSVLDDHYVLSEITLLLLAAVSAVPLLPMQVLSIGVAIDIFYFASALLAATEGLTAPVAPTEPGHFAFMIMLTLLSTGISAMIYHRRVATFEAHQEALRATEILSNAQSRALLAETAVSVGRLAAAVTHEINTPLGALRSSVDTISKVAERVCNADANERLRYSGILSDLRHSVNESADRLSLVIARLQRLIELENNEKRIVETAMLLKDIVALFETELDHGRITLRLALHATPPLLCNPQQLSAVLSHVLRNAVGAIEGPGTIVVAISEVGSMVEISIQDSGRGMDQNELATAFDPGFRVSGGRIAAGSWSLFTSRQIVHEHGGEMYIESEPGRGTVVRISLPCLVC